MLRNSRVILSNPSLRALAKQSFNDTFRTKKIALLPGSMQAFLFLAMTKPTLSLRAIAKQFTSKGKIQKSHPYGMALTFYKTESLRIFAFAFSVAFAFALLFSSSLRLLFYTCFWCLFFNFICRLFFKFADSGRTFGCFKLRF